MAKRLLGCMILLVCLWLPLVAPATPYSQLIIFGDSLSDTGNLSSATGGRIPGSPYFAGRFSNGPNYTDGLADVLDLPLVLPSLRGGTNYAFGGARTGSHPINPAFSVRSQLRQFTLSLRGKPANTQALYVVFAGANNLQDAIQTQDPSQALAMVTSAIHDLRDIIVTLGKLGARHVLVPNLPNLGVTPRVTERGAAAAAFATELTQVFNALLDAMLDTVPHLHVIRFDTFALLQEIVARPHTFGLINVTARCYTGDDVTFSGGGSVCVTPFPDEHLFWDGIHPTGAGHAILANRMTAAMLDIHRLRLRAGNFTLRAQITLGAVHDGIDPLTEAVTLRLGTFVRTIGPGSFVLTPGGPFGTVEFTGTIEGAELAVQIRPRGDDEFTIRATGEHESLAANNKPFEIELSIGNDTGKAQVR